MNLGSKIEITALILVIFHHSTTADNEFFNKCPEFNPQNELDIDLVSQDILSFLCNVR